MNSDIVSYYKNRALEYEKVYSKPERQNDLSQATKIIQETFASKDVFEIACGTGFWTQKIAASANNILATDINDSVIEIAKSKNYPTGKVSFEIADVFNPTNSNKHKNLFGGFIWSHIKMQDITVFIDLVNKSVEPGGIVLLMDNNYVDGSNLPITDKDDFGNTYQIRTLENGETYNVLKNFPTETCIKQLLAGKATDIEFINLQYFWILRYNI